jgi:hypothetical protein
MASTALGTRLTQAHRQQQLAVRARLLRTMLSLWPLFDPTDIDRSWGAMEPALTALVDQGRRESAMRAGTYFQAFRAAEGVPGTARIPALAPLPREQVITSLRVTGPVTAKTLIERGVQDIAPRTFTSLSGSAGRMALSGGVDLLLGAVREDSRAVGWARVTDFDPCAFCALLAGRGGVYSRESVRFRAHDNCVIGSTIVSGPEVEVAYRRWYEGEVVVISLTSGDQLTITPQHPVLTDRGWVDPQLLRPGDNVVHCLGLDDRSRRVPDEHQMPAAIEDVWRALSVNGFRSVPVSPEDFHGDGVGTEGDVDVVAPDRLLADVFEPASVERGAEQIGAGARAAAVPHAFAPARDVALPFLGSLHASDGIMRGSGFGSVLGGCQCGRVKGARQLRTATLNALLSQASGDDIARDAVLLRDSLLGHAVHVVGNDGFYRECEPRIPGTLASGSRFDPPAPECESERLRVHADYGGRLLERLSGAVEFRTVSDLRRVDFAGHVYNLRTGEGWYNANSIVVSNCACTAEPVYSRTASLPGRGDEFARLYNESTAGADGDLLNVFRRAYEAQRRAA